MVVQRRQPSSTPATARPLLALCIFALLRGVSAGLFPEGSSVLQLTPESFDAELSKARPVLVAFYAPWCAQGDLADLALPCASTFAYVHFMLPDSCVSCLRAGVDTVRASYQSGELGPLVHTLLPTSDRSITTTLSLCF